MNSVKKAVMGAAVGALAMAGVVGLPGTASAGSNGQQIEYYDYRSDTYSVRVYGYDQTGSRVIQCFNTPSKSNVLSGWWWKGDVSIDGFGDSNCGRSPGQNPSPQHLTTSWVPTSYAGDAYKITNQFADLY